MPTEFYCEKCDFKCSKQSIFNKHLETVKHKNVGYIHGYLGYNDTKNILSEKMKIVSTQHVVAPYII